MLKMDGSTAQRRVVCLVHGGAGTLRDEAVPVAVAGVSAAVKRGLAALVNGGSALDAVEAATMVMEDHPFFNAGRGSVLTREGQVEMDALIVDGKTVHPGAVTMIRRVKNPIRVARKVMEKTPHVFIAGAGAEELARREGLELVDPSYFITEVRQKQLQRALEEESSGVVQPEDHVHAAAAAAAPVLDVARMPAAEGKPAAGARTVFDIDPLAADEGDHDTVGAVAIDMHGNVAAATSTGGLTAKWAGRIGDTPVFGCGGFADNEAGACSTTGTGEFIIRAMLAKAVCDAYERLQITAAGSGAAGAAPADADVAAASTAAGAAARVGCAAVPDDARAAAAAEAALVRMAARSGDPGTGLIFVSPSGGVGFAHSSPRMSWAAAIAPAPCPTGGAPATGGAAAGGPTVDAAAASAAASDARASVPGAGALSPARAGTFLFAAGHELPLNHATGVRVVAALPFAELPLAELDVVAAAAASV